MKSLIYKEFAMMRKSMLVLGALRLFACIMLLNAKDPLYFLYFNLICVSEFVRNLNDDETNGWDKYSRALPFTAYQRVGAKYLFCFILFFATNLTAWIFFAIGINNAEPYEYVIGYMIAQDFQPLLVPFGVFYLSITVISMAFALLVSCVGKGQVKGLLVSAMFIPAILGMFFLRYFSTERGSYIILAFCEPQITAMIATAAVLFFAASYFISVIVETKSGREKLRNVKIIGAVLTAAAVAVSGAAVYGLYKEGMFEKKVSNLLSTEAAYEEQLKQREEEKKQKEEEEKQRALARADMMKIAESICGETLSGRRTEDILAKFKELGFADYIVESDDFFYSEKPVSISTIVYGSGSTEYSDGIKIKADVTRKYLPTVDPVARADEIEAEFYEGMTEEDAVALMAEYDLCPEQIREVVADGKPCRTYTFSASFDSSDDKYMMMSFDIVDGVIADTWTYKYFGGE